MEELHVEHNLTIEEMASRRMAEKDSIITRLQLDLADARGYLEAARRDRDAAERTLKVIRDLVEAHV